MEKLLLPIAFYFPFSISSFLFLVVHEGKTGNQEEKEQQTSVHDISISIKCLIGVYISSFGPTRSRYRSSARFLVQPRVSSSFLSRTTRRMSDVSWRWAASLGSRGEWGRRENRAKRIESEKVHVIVSIWTKVYRYCIFQIRFLFDAISIINLQSVRKRFKRFNI